jgi:hypothetical protein
VAKIRPISHSGVASELEACHLADRVTVQARQMYTHYVPQSASTSALDLTSPRDTHFVVVHAQYSPSFCIPSWPVPSGQARGMDIYFPFCVPASMGNREDE